MLQRSHHEPPKLLLESQFLQPYYQTPKAWLSNIGYTPTEKSHGIDMWPTRGPHVFTCGPHVLFQFHAFTHMWETFFTCETRVRSCKHMWMSCVPHVAHINSHVAKCEAHVGSYLLPLRSHVEWTCEIGTTHKIHMWIPCDFSVRHIMCLFRQSNDSQNTNKHRTQTKVNK